MDGIMDMHRVPLLPASRSINGSPVSFTVNKSALLDKSLGVFEAEEWNA